MTKQDINMSGAVVSGSVVGGIGNTVVQGAAYSDEAALRKALDEWLTAAPCSSPGYAEVAKLERELAAGGVAAAKRAFAGFAESLAASLAGTALWEVIKKVFCVG